MRQCVFIEDQETWTALIRGKPLDVFYSYEYVQLNARAEESAGLIYFKGLSGELYYPFLKRRIFHTHYFDIITPYGYGGPEIVGELTPQELAVAKQSFRKWAVQQGIVSELIRYNPLTKNEKKIPDWAEKEFVRHTTSIDLRPSVEKILQTFHKKNRSMIRKSIASDLTVRYGSEEDVQTFVDLYYQTMDRKKASLHYYFTRDYFERLFQPTELCQPLLLMAEWKGQAVGAYFVLLGHSCAHGHLIGCQRDDHNLFPNQRLEYEVILYAKAAGMVEQHLGGGYREHDSLFESKCRYTGYRVFEYHQGKTILLPRIYEQLCERYGRNEAANYFPAYRHQETVVSI